MAATPRPSARRSWLSLDFHHRLLAAAAATVVAGFLIHGHAKPVAALVASWDVFAGCSVGLALLVVLTQDPYEMRRTVRLQDASLTLLFAVVMVAAVASLLAVGVLLGQAKMPHEPRLAGRVVLSIATVAISWLLVHTTFALRYAHHYYTGARDGARGSVSGGLIFPGEKNPDYLDFAYFSFVIAMTCQVSDVQVAGRSLRRTALWHGLISFTFNTAILALAINLVAGLL